MKKIYIPVFMATIVFVSGISWSIGYNRGASLTPKPCRIYPDEKIMGTFYYGCTSEQLNNFYEAYKNIKEKDKEISIISEKKECDKQGGEFNIQVDKITYPNSDKVRYNPTGITCTAPTKEIFKYEI